MRNQAINIIKMLSCFAVISLHFGGVAYGRRLAVPAFMFVSFYLSFGKLTSGDVSCFWRRLARLFVPYAFWGVAGYCFGVCIGRDFGFRDVIMQLLTGYPTAEHLYYVTLLMGFTALVFAVETCLEKKGKTMVYVIMFAGSLAMQYSGWNHALCSQIDGIVKHTPGRIPELLPMAVLGVSFCRLEKMSQTIRNGWRWLMAASVTVLLAGCVMLVLGIPAKPLGFGYQGLQDQLLCASLCSIMILLGGRISLKSRWLDFVGAATAGIYFMHMVVGECLQRALGFGKSNLAALAIFIACLVITALLDRSKWTRWIVR